MCDFDNIDFELIVGNEQQIKKFVSDVKKEK